ncbi:MAG: RNA-binding cell elongation regulator Jag/EloR [Acidimicrobiales bacterium]
MEWVEIAGKTLEEAKQSALEHLGVAEIDAEVVVVAEPRIGLFGRSRGEARVRARVRPAGPRPKRQRRPRRSPDRRSRDARASVEGDDGAGSGKPEVRGRTNEPGGARRRSRSRRSGASQNAAHEVLAEISDVKRESDDEEENVAEGVTLEEQGDVAREFIQGLLAAYGYEAAVATRELDEETLEVAANGEGLGLLVGPRGATLAALQDVTRTVVQHRFPTRTDRIVVDVSFYRQRRAEALERFTRQVAEEVSGSGAEQALEPMSPADRKVVHDTVNAMDGLVTRSEGEEPHRHVVIAPAD